MRNGRPRRAKRMPRVRPRRSVARAAAGVGGDPPTSLLPDPEPPPPPPPPVGWVAWQALPGGVEPTGTKFSSAFPVGP